MCLLGWVFFLGGGGLILLVVVWWKIIRLADRLDGREGWFEQWFVSPARLGAGACHERLIARSVGWIWIWI
jgi:hypothetical protein